LIDTMSAIDPSLSKAPIRSRRQNLRRRFRDARRSLTATQHHRHAVAAARQVMTSGLPLAFDRFALYLANDGELDPAPLMSDLKRIGKRIALPVLDGDRLAFHAWDPSTVMVRNRFGIREPDPRRSCPWSIATIGALFLPLVAFDARGHRLGMGGGFYDRSLDAGQAPRLPLLVGLAHAQQEADTLPAARWDVPLDAVVTEHGYRPFTTRAARFARDTTVVDN
jgi:5-formyltetrahydrofolate cyclo-ligase